MRDYNKKNERNYSKNLIIEYLVNRRDYKEEWEESYNRIFNKKYKRSEGCANSKIMSKKRL
jgi:hypothetical protein